MITFDLTWGVVALLFLFYDQMVAVFGELSMSNPIFILLVYSPGLAGVYLVWQTYGFKGLKSFIQRLTLWRAPRAWWAFLFLGIPVIAFSGAIIKGSIVDPFPFTPWYRLFPAVGLARIDTSPDQQTSSTLVIRTNSMLLRFPMAVGPGTAIVTLC